MKKKTKYSTTRDLSSKYPDNSPRPFIYKDTDSVRVMETVKNESKCRIERVTPKA